jgi:hypothetical protein
MLTSNKDRWALSVLESAKIIIEKIYPNDKKLISHITQALMLVCYKIERKEGQNEKQSNDSRC